MNIQNSVFYVGGSKGGVGKSLFSFALVDYLLNRNANVLLVDTDTDNPDVFKAHKELALPNLLCRLNCLDDADGWAARMDMRLEYSQSATRLPTAGKSSVLPFFSTASRALELLYISKRRASPKYRFRQTWMGTSVNTS